MTRYVAFLRAINVGGHVVRMEVLRELFASMHLDKVETFIASGNVIFSTKRQDREALRNSIESSLKKALGYEVTTFLRTVSEVGEIASYEAFPLADVNSATTFCVGMLEAPPDAEAVKRALAIKPEMDAFHFRGAEFYWLSKQKQSESKFSAAALEKAIKARVTFRGMNTMRKLVAMLASS
jgi:uncharacterized protein (DUF1697 family)